MNGMEFLIKKTSGEIQANFDDVKAFLKQQMTAYTSLEVTEDNIPERKKDLSSLRKLRKGIDERRLEAKREYQKPLVAFEDKVKELLSVVDEPISLLDEQLKGFEQQRIAEKKEHNRRLYEDTIGDYAEYLPFEYLDRPEWLNKSTSDKIIIDAIQTAIITCQNAIQAIKALNSPIEEELLSIYARSHDMSLAVKRATDYTRDLELIKKIEQAPVTVAPVEEPSIVELTEEKVGEIINKAEIVAIYVKAEDYDRAKNVLMFNEIELF